MIVCPYYSVVMAGRSLQAGCYGFEFCSSPHRSLHRGKDGRCQQLVANVLHEWAVLLSLSADRDPLGVSEECAPTLLALNHAVPGKQVGEPLIALAD